MKIAITQPNYLPWLGYFAQLNACDHLVVLDDVQFARREWQNRNRIINRQGLVSFLTLPTRKAPRSSRINEMCVSKDFSFVKHLNLISAYYRLFDGKNDTLKFLESLLDDNLLQASANLSILNTSLFCQISSHAQICFDISFSSQICPVSFSQDSITPTERLLEICKKLDARTYLSSFGARHYMEEELFKFRDSSVEIVWQKFNHRPYISSTLSHNFVSHMSVVDYICNSSLSTLKEYVQNCHYEEPEDKNNY